MSEETYLEWLARARKETPEGEPIVVPERYVVKGKPAPHHTIDLEAISLVLALFPHEED